MARKDTDDAPKAPTKAELADVAEELGADVTSSMTKPEIAQAVVEAVQPLTGNVAPTQPEGQYGGAAPVPAPPITDPQLAPFFANQDTALPEQPAPGTLPPRG